MSSSLRGAVVFHLRFVVTVEPAAEYYSRGEAAEPTSHLDGGPDVRMPRDVVGDERRDMRTLRVQSLRVRAAVDVSRVAICQRGQEQKRVVVGDSRTFRPTRLLLTPLDHPKYQRCSTSMHHLCYPPTTHNTEVARARLFLPDDSKVSCKSQKPGPDSLSAMAVNTAALSSHFPLTLPVPNPITHPDLVPLAELALEVDLLRSGSGNLSRWVHHINNVTASVLQAELDERGQASPAEVSLLGTKLSTPAGRKGLQRLTDLYERALTQFPGSFKLWKQYLDARSSYVLGQPKKKVNLKAPKKKAGEGDDGLGPSGLVLRTLNEGVKDLETGLPGEELDESERDVDASYEGGLDGIVGAEEWRALAGAYERALMWLPRVSGKCSEDQTAWSGLY